MKPILSSIYLKERKNIGTQKTILYLWKLNVAFVEELLNYS